MGIGNRARAIRAELQRRRARLPWAELEAEARRQGCSPADIFFDRAGRVSESELTAPGACAWMKETNATGRRWRTRSPFANPARGAVATDRDKEEQG